LEEEKDEKITDGEMNRMNQIAKQGRTLFTALLCLTLLSAPVKLCAIGRRGLKLPRGFQNVQRAEALPLTQKPLV